MRRIIHNTTAIAACLSLLAPHFATAQTAAPEEGAEQQPAEAAVDERVGELVEEAICADGTAAPCAEAAEALPQEPVAVTGEAAPPDGMAEPQGEVAEEQPDAIEPVPVEAEAAAEAGAGATAEVEPQEMPADEAAPAEADPLADALAEQADELQAGAEDQEMSADAPAQMQADPPADQAAVGEAATEIPAAAEQAAPSADAATDEDALAEALAREAGESEPAPVEAPAGDSADSAATAEAKPAPEDGAAETPAPEAAAAEVATQAPEAGVQETDAAREAAEGREAPTAAALNDEAEGEAAVSEEQVTEENSRSSDEDFTTSLRDALAVAAGGQQAPTRAEGGDDGSDLTKALLLGAGALAVGTMLNNNRQVAVSTPDRVVVIRPDGSQQVIKDEVALLRQPGSTVTTENFDDGSSRTIVTRPDGSKVVTIRDADLRVLRRTLVSADGATVRLIDDSAAAEPVDISRLPAPARVTGSAAGTLNEQQLREALLREAGVDRRFTLAQIRDIPQVRALVAPVNIDAITFETGSAAIQPDQAKQLSGLGKVIRDAIAADPREMFLIEGHTDTVGSDPANLALSDRRAESVALALAEYFDVPPENMVVQGYGEQFLKIRREGDVRENRRASVRRITDLLQTAAN